MRLRCPKCDHNWETRKESVPKQCPWCKSSTYFHKPMIVRK
jgi:predicted Zn-ribbon and HTH transcriptional regulator